MRVLVTAVAVLGTLGTAQAAPPEARVSAQVELRDDDGFRLVDMVVAEIDSAVVTYSELLAETRLALLERRGPEMAGQAAITLELLRAVLRSIVSRELLLGEARRLQLRDVPQAEVDRELDRLRTFFGSHELFLSFLASIGFNVSEEIREQGLAPPELLAIVRANLQVARFVDLRIRPSIVPAEADIRRCFEANKARLVGQKLADTRPVIEQTLRDQLAQVALRRLLVQLSEQASLRFSPDFRVSMTEPGPLAEDPMALQCPLPTS